MKTKIFTTLFFIIQLNTFAQSITGTWELIYTAPVDMMDSEPRGIVNVKLYFTNYGKLFNLSPEEILTDSSEQVDYIFRDDTLNITPPNGEAYKIKVMFIDSVTMSFASNYSVNRIFKRIEGEDAFNKEIEFKSLQLINTGDSTSIVLPTVYDDTDYSSLSSAKRIIGIWEVIAYEDVPTHEMPPYGFPNDIWTFDSARLHMLNRIENDTVHAKYILSENNFILTRDDGEIISWKYSFDKWGHMLFDSGKGKIIFKLVSKDSSSRINIPLKIVLLKLAGEK